MAKGKSGGKRAKTISNEIRLESENNLNPYAEAFSKKHGKFNAVEYMHWIESKHNEFQKSTGARMSKVTSTYDPKTMKKFIKFINN